VAIAVAHFDREISWCSTGRESFEANPIIPFDVDFAIMRDAIFGDDCFELSSFHENFVVSTTESRSEAAIERTPLGMVDTNPERELAFAFCDTDIE